MTFSTHPKFTIWRFFEYGLELPGSEPSKSLSSFTVTLTMHICVLTHFHFVQTLQKSDYQLSSTQIFGWLAMSRFLFCNNTLKYPTAHFAVQFIDTVLEFLSD